MSSEILYAVLKLNTEVNTTDFFGVPVSIQLQGAGYIPVYNTLKEAQESAGEKYQIIAIKTSDL